MYGISTELFYARIERPSVGHVVPGVVVFLLWYYYRGPCVRKLFTGLIMYYPLKIKNIVLYCIRTCMWKTVFSQNSKNKFTI